MASIDSSDEEPEDLGVIENVNEPYIDVEDPGL